jgi:hypothetical protein
MDAQLSLFERLSCKVLITCPSLAQPLKPLLSTPSKIRRIQAPTLDEFLSEEPVPHYSYDKTFENVSDKPLGFLHTSGSSGRISSNIPLPALTACCRKSKANQLEYEVH